jgi:hypothetical protein
MVWLVEFPLQAVIQGPGLEDSVDQEVEAYQRSFPTYRPAHLDLDFLLPTVDSRMLEEAKDLPGQGNSLSKRRTRTAQEGIMRV